MCLSCNKNFVPTIRKQGPLSHHKLYTPANELDYIRIMSHNFTIHICERDYLLNWLSSVCNVDGVIYQNNEKIPTDNPCEVSYVHFWIICENISTFSQIHTPCHKQIIYHSFYFVADITRRCFFLSVFFWRNMTAQ